MDIAFDDVLLPDWLESNPEEIFDTLAFGVVKMDGNGVVLVYSRPQSALSGVSRENAKGKNFFTQVAPCTNNFMVAEKYNMDQLDEILPYMFTYITKPTPVELRLIKRNNTSQYLLAKNAQM